MPYRLLPGHFTSNEEEYIEGVMDGMTDATDGCIEFYNDSDTQCRF